MFSLKLKLELGLELEGWKVGGWSGQILVFPLKLKSSKTMVDDDEEVEQPYCGFLPSHVLLSQSGSHNRGESSVVMMIMTIRLMIMMTHFLLGLAY